jgi:23S rRNA pseudouridine1911/1915/1917 synthase
LAFQVPASEAGERLDHFLVGLIPDHSRSQIQRLIKAGHVRLGGRTATPHTAVRAGDAISVDVPPAVEAKPAAQPLPLDILYEDEDLVVVNKAAGMVVHPAAGHADGTLVNALLHHIEDLSGVGGERRPGIVHRLDRGTSGVMVVAKNDAAHAELTRQFHDREVEKEYIALVWGLVQAGRRIDAPIGRDSVHRLKMSARARRARSAVTRVTHAETLRGVSLLHVAIATGRTHQIRVHLSAIGHPIVGDRLYGGVRRHLPADLRALPHLERPFLHAARLAFTHPVDGRRLEFNAPLPGDLQAVLDQLRSDQEKREER